MPFTFPAEETAWPSEKELAQVAEMREACKDQLATLPTKARDVVGDLRLCRFLRFNKGDVKKASQGYGKFLDFRVNAGLDNMRQHLIDLSLDDFCAWMDKVRSPYTPPQCLWPGPDEHLLVYVQPGFFKATEFAKKRPACHTLDTDLLLAWLFIERILKYIDDRSYATGKIVYTVKILDFQNFGKETSAIRVPEIRRWAQTNIPPLMQNYCEHDILIFVVNAPFAFRAAFVFASALMSRRQVARVRVVGSSTGQEAQRILTDLEVPDYVVNAAKGVMPSKPVRFLYPRAWDDEQRVQAFLGKQVAEVEKNKPVLPDAGAPAKTVEDPQAGITGSQQQPQRDATSEGEDGALATEDNPAADAAPEKAAEVSAPSVAASQGDGGQSLSQTAASADAVEKPDHTQGAQAGPKETQAPVVVEGLPSNGQQPACLCCT